ncbi:MAG: hypothetical protein L0Z62_50100 [Gemmataceae bacterium]|nr:hypothetical protein [Gemmataceae bacterium]
MAKKKSERAADEPGQPAKKKQRGLYRRLMLWVFQHKEPEEATGELLFSQADLRQAAAALGEEARNFPDLPYNLRSRSGLPPELIEAGYTTIAMRGSGQYALVMEEDKIEIPADVPVVGVSTAPIPDTIRDIIRADEQSILSAMNYLDIVSDFMGRKAHHLQAHLRTTGSLGQQVEADDVWVAVVEAPSGERTVLPIEAKAVGERLGLHQMISTIDAVLKKYPGIPLIPLAAKLEESGLLLLIAFSYRLAEGKITAITPTRFKRYRLTPKLPLWPGPS